MGKEKKKDGKGEKEKENKKQNKKEDEREEEEEYKCINVIAWPDAMLPITADVKRPRRRMDACLVWVYEALTVHHASYSSSSSSSSSSSLNDDDDSALHAVYT